MWLAKILGPAQKGIRWMRLSHARRAISVRFDDPNLVSCAGLVPVMALAAPVRARDAAGRGLTLAGRAE